MPTITSKEIVKGKPKWLKKKYKYTEAGMKAYKKAVLKIKGNKSAKTDSTSKSPAKGY